MLLAKDEEVDIAMAQICLKWSRIMKNWVMQKSPDM